MRIRRAVCLLVAVPLAGCATASDIKPGVIRGVDDRGYVKTTEGFALALSGCSDAEIWRAVRLSASQVRVSDSTSFWKPRSLGLLDVDELAGSLRAKDDGWLNGVSYVGIYLHRVRPDLRLVEVTAFWHGRSVVLRNPWEPALLEDLRSRLAACVQPAAKALEDPTGVRGYPIPAKQEPISEPQPDSSAILCRQRADRTSGREAWLAEYQRCMAGY